MPGFSDENEDLLHLYDIAAKTYGCLPSDIAKLDWKDLLLTVQCLRMRSQRITAIIRKNRYKKGMVFPNLSISDLGDLL